MISERNKEIYQRRKNGASLQVIAADYRLSRERVRQICFEVESAKRRAERGDQQPRHRIVREDTELFRLIEANPLQRRHTIQMRAYTCLYRAWCKRYGYKAGFPTMEFFKSMSYQEICDMQNAGPMTISYLTDLKFALADMNGGVISAEAEDQDV